MISKSAIWYVCVLSIENFYRSLFPKILAIDFWVRCFCPTTKYPCIEKINLKVILLYLTIPMITMIYYDNNDIEDIQKI